MGASLPLAGTRGKAELDAENRLAGHSIWLQLTLPLSVQMPPGAKS
jgi:hypothetical protein